MTERPPPADTGSPLWRRWKEVDRLFEAALDVPEDRRVAFLRDQCAGDTELYDLLAELLDITASKGTPLDGPGPLLLRAALDAADDIDGAAFSPGQRIGRYRIIGEIGRGGMATVYEAERADGSFERRVAIKVMRRGTDTDDVVRRFLAERQILSGLTHPNIARLLDGGATEDGLPYLVMDRVDGKPITRWADEKRLSVAQRLALFLQVADAVHHAHQRLVVHRDLKPSNILVTEDGVAKLLDFGIAKLLSHDDELTGLGPRPLTPHYASPEQLRGDTVTTRSDVYQLGVLLHVLLTGSRPRDRAAALPGYDAADFTRPSSVVDPRTGPRARTRADDAGAAATARSTSPAALRRSLRGDLDTIVLEALRPDPSLRYDSASAMAEDVRRSLSGHPILARPASIGYRFGRFLRRNRWFLPAAALFAGALLTVAATQVRHSRQLERERNEARAQADRAERLRGFLINLFGAADPWAPVDSIAGREITVVQALESGTARARAELDGQPLLLADLLSAIALVHERLDQRAPALELLNEVVTLRESLSAIPTAEYSDEIGRRGSLLGLMGFPDSAEAGWRRRLEFDRAIFGEDHPRVAEALMTLSSGPGYRGAFDEQLGMLDEAVRIIRESAPDRIDLLADALSFRADALRNLGRPVEAESAAVEAFDLHRLILGDDHPSVAIKRVHLAQALTSLNRHEEALTLYRDALPVLERTLGPDHYNTERSWNNYALVLVAVGDVSEAEKVHRRVLETRRRVAGTDLNDEVAASIQNLAATVLRQDRFAEAESLAVEAGRIYGTVMPEGHYLTAFPLLTLAESRLRRGAPADAETAARSALDILSGALPGSYPAEVARCRLGAAVAARGAPSDGRPLVAEALSRLEVLEGVPERVIEECRAALAGLAGTGG